MQLRFPISQTVISFHSLEPPSDRPTEQADVSARETTIVPAGHEVVILGEHSHRVLGGNQRVFLHHQPQFARNTKFWLSILFVSLMS